MAASGFAIFETALGWCALVWGERGLAGVHLPEADERRTRTRVARSAPQARELPPPPVVAAAIERIVSLLDGEPDDLAGVALDLDGVPAFHRRVYEVARTIPPGATLTYGEVARRVGEPGAAQAVGQALGHNPCPIVVPCHRVVAAGGRLGGFSAPGGGATKRRMLEIEGARDRGALTLFGDA